jgi:tetratricopeptide (TPR) repeat protein
MRVLNPRRLAAVLLLAAAPALAQKPASMGPDPNIISPEMDHWLMEGIDNIYRMNFDEAEADARRAIALNPAQPNAYMGLAGVAWTRYVYDSDQNDDALLKTYEQRTNETITVAERWLKYHPKDAQAYYCLGAAYGVESRLLLIRREWIKAYVYGRRALSFTREAVKIDPQLWDAYLGLGMYDYYSDIYPRFIGVLAKLVLRGNRLKGIETLEMVAEKGHYSANNAKILLVEIYTEDPLGARNPARAIQFAEDLREKYPDSAMLHSAYMVAQYEGGKFEDAVETARNYIARSKKGEYNPYQVDQGWVGLGCALWQLDRKPEALAAFREGQKTKLKGKLTRWAIWSYLRAAQLEDNMGQRNDAKRDYGVVLAYPDVMGIHTLAKAGLAKPFSDAKPGPIPPP